MGLEMAKVPEFRRWRPHEGALCHTRNLGRVPRGWHVYRVDIALFHRGPIARVTEQKVRRRIYLERRGFTAWNCRYLIGAFDHVERPDRCQRPWRPAVKWLMDLTPGFEITATAWCAPGERVEIDQRWDWALSWPHASWPWLDFVVAGGWVFCAEEEEIEG
jgi:hypothetical protein